MKIAFALWVLIAPLAFSQTVIQGPPPMPMVGGSVGASGSWALVSSVGAKALTSGGTATTNLDTTGAKFLAVSVMWAGGGPVVFTETGFTNTWTISQNYTNNNPKAQWYYVTNATGHVGAGHTFAVSCTGLAVAFHVFAFSANGQPTLDTETAGNRSGSWNGNTLLAGSISPSTPTNLCLSAVVWDVSGATTVTNNAGFQYPQTFTYAGNGLQSGFKIKTNDVAAENPGWIQFPSVNNDADVNHISFYLK